MKKNVRAQRTFQRLRMPIAEEIRQEGWVWAETNMRLGRDALTTDEFPRFHIMWLKTRSRATTATSSWHQALNAEREFPRAISQKSLCRWKSSIFSLKNVNPRTWRSFSGLMTTSESLNNLNDGTARRRTSTERYITARAVSLWLSLWHRLSVK